MEILIEKGNEINKKRCPQQNMSKYQPVEKTGNVGHYPDSS